MQKMLKNIFGKTAEERRDRVAFMLIGIGAVFGLVASIVLSVESIELAKNKDAVLPCSINDVLNCATVGSSKSASVLPGVPNSFFGMVTLPVVLTIAVAGFSGTKFPRWFMRAALGGAAIGMIFAGWMLYESLFVIQALCPWCLTLDAGMLLLAFGFWRYVVSHNILGFSVGAQKKMQRIAENGFDALALVLVFFAAIAGIIIRFGDALFL